MNQKTLSKIKELQRNEITEYIIYSKLSKKTENTVNKKILKEMAFDEKGHYRFWKQFTKQDIKPNMMRVHFYMLLSHIFGLSFGLKLMERGERLTIEAYKKLMKEVKKNEVKKNISIINDEHKHEKELLNMFKEERVEYAGSVVLGLNDALVELTGALAGFTFALQKSSLIATAGFITGFAASLSMAASSFLASREEADHNKEKNPFKSSVYTGISYLITVILLILPFLIFKNVYVALAIVLTIGVCIIAAYTFFISTVKNLKFWRRFLEMAAISFSVAVISFVVGLLLRIYFGIEV